jgi:hypothetical protein
MKRKPHAHPWLQTGPLPETREWLRLDPGYDDPEHEDLTWHLFGEAIAASIIIFVLIVLASLQDVR